MKIFDKLQVDLNKTFNFDDPFCQSSTAWYTLNTSKCGIGSLQNKCRRTSEETCFTNNRVRADKKLGGQKSAR